MTLAHVLLTRFNLPSQGTESLVRARTGWLHNRQQLFERYCLPSVRAQSNQDFHWLIYLDPQSPDWLRRRIDDLGTDGLFTAKYRESVSREDLRADIDEVVSGTPDRLVTTNLDNDDGLAIDFVERVRRADPGQGRYAVYLEWGLIRSSDRVYLRHDDSNAFCSVVEPWREPMTCWFDWHNTLEQHMPVIRVQGEPSWLQVVHQANVSNRVRGRLVGPENYERLFGVLLDGTLSPSKRAVMGECLWNLPRRAGSELIRLIVKRTVLAVAGRDGLDKIKQLRVGARASG